MSHFASSPRLLPRTAFGRVSSILCARSARFFLLSFVVSGTSARTLVEVCSAEHFELDDAIERETARYSDVMTALQHLQVDIHLVPNTFAAYDSCCDNILVALQK